MAISKSLDRLTITYISPGAIPGSMFYPWRGEFTVGSEASQIAIDTLASRMDFPDDLVAIWGQHKTENLGVEKIVANIVSNPNIRYLILCGDEVRGHRSGQTISSLHANGIDANGRIIGALGAVPFVENVPPEAVERFRQQVELVNMIGETSIDKVIARARELASRPKESFGEPIVVEFAEREKAGPGMAGLAGKVSLHKDILLDPYLDVEPMEVGGEQQ